MKARFAKYGITQDEYDDLLAKQDECCAICQSELDEEHIDHDHVTGKVRGILCRTCNVGLGMFKDSEFRLTRAIMYLKSNQLTG